MVRLNDLFGKEGGGIELPEPDIEIPLSGESDLTPEMVRGISIASIIDRGAVSGHDIG